VFTTISKTAVAKRDSRQVIRWNQRFLHLRGHYAFHSTACTPATPREKGSVEGAVRYLKTGFWPARRFETLDELDRVYGLGVIGSRTSAGTRRGSSSSLTV
jgi:transposase